MTATIPIPFAVGQKLWAISTGHSETWITCPECNGTKILTLVKGNGEIIELRCNYCERDFEPRGIVRRVVYDCQPLPFVPKRVEMYGQEFRYSESSPDATAYQFYESSDLFEDREACAAACVGPQRCASSERRAAGACQPREQASEPRTFFALLDYAVPESCLGCLAMLIATATSAVVCSWLFRLAWIWWPWR